MFFRKNKQIKKLNRQIDLATIIINNLNKKIDMIRESYNKEIKELNDKIKELSNTNKKVTKK